MPPLPVVPNVIKCVVECIGNDGRLAANVFHMTYSGGPPASGDCDTIAEDLWNAWVTNFTPTQPAQTSLSLITVTDLSTDLGGQGSYDNSGTPVPGTSTHGMLPLHTCFLLSKFVAYRYRGGHPRSYLPIGTTNDLNDDGDWKGSSYAPWVTAWFQFVDAIMGGTYGPATVAQECAVSYKHAGEPRVTPLVMDIPVDGYSGSEKLATQRRRVRKTARRR